MEILFKKTSGRATGSPVSQPNEIEIQLTAHSLFKLNGDSRGMQISAARGKLWVTQQGDPVDYLLQPGEKVRVTQKGIVLIQGFSDARVRMVLARNSHTG